MLEKYILEKPKQNKNFSLNELKEKMIELQELIYNSNNPEYLYWTDLKYKNSIREKINPEDFLNGLVNFLRYCFTE